MKFLPAFHQCLVALVLRSDPSWGWVPINNNFAATTTATTRSSFSCLWRKQKVPQGRRASNVSLNGRHHRRGLWAVPGADIEQPSVEDDEQQFASPLKSSKSTKVKQSAPSKNDNGGGGPVVADSVGSLAVRGKKNEIDFTVAPYDVSLSRAYSGETSRKSSTSATVTTSAVPATKTESNGATAAGSSSSPPLMSLSLALNNASNRAVRRIILARSWPSAEALNLSLRQVAEAERKAVQEQQQQLSEQAKSVSGDGAGAGAVVVTTAKCPVPRPILNVLTRKRRDNSATASSPPDSISSTVQQPKPRSRTDEEYVADQLRSFREKYGSCPNYEQAEDYLASVLSLATSGIESTRAPGVGNNTAVPPQLHGYQDSYRRLLGVLRTVGVVFETDPATQRRKISNRFSDNDICLSMLDRIQLENEKEKQQVVVPSHETSTESAAAAAATKTATPSEPMAQQQVTETQQEAKSDTTKEEQGKKSKQGEEGETGKSGPFKNPFRKDKSIKNNKAESADQKDNEQSSKLTKDDLGGVLLSAEEPSMTRQLNILSNIVLRALLFGGDQELLVLAETLDADRAAFVERWYPSTGGLLNDSDLQKETRPGVQYLNCLIDLLRECYDNGMVVDLQPSLPLSQSYANAYERLVAMAVELGSGYLKPAPTSALPKPRTAKEELGRLALWESQFRMGTPDTSPYPEDLEGVWEVRDEIGGETIGTTSVTLKEDGEVVVDAPLEGLRWRLDPGPTHLDTCTFQVLNTDGTILQYRGFIDRGARLEARFSKRAVRIRGSVMFQMRDGSVDYYRDILPINYRDGTTKFVMTKVVE